MTAHTVVDRLPEIADDPSVDWSDGRWTLAEVARARGHVTRVLIHKEPGRDASCDVAQIVATLPGGRLVPVQLRIPHCRYAELVTRMLAWARSEHVYAKRLGLIDRANWTVMS